MNNQESSNKTTIHQTDTHPQDMKNNQSGIKHRGDREDIRIPTYVKQGRRNRRTNGRTNSGTNQMKPNTKVDVQGTSNNHLKSFSLTRFKTMSYIIGSTLLMKSSAIAYAKDDGVKEITDGIDVMTNIVLAAVAGVGVIFLAIALIDFGTAYSAHQTAEQSVAIRKVIGALIVIAIPAILKVLGVG